MATSAAMQYTYSGFIQTSFSGFSEKIGTGMIRDKIDKLSVNGNNDWNVYDDTLKTILSFQLSQYSEHQNEKRLEYT
jgi:hypothetical protein